MPRSLEIVESIPQVEAYFQTGFFLSLREHKPYSKRKLQAIKPKKKKRGVVRSQEGTSAHLGFLIVLTVEFIAIAFVTVQSLSCV